MNNQVEAHQSSIGGLQANMMALLCYLIGAILAFIPVIMHVAWLAPLVIFFLEKESRFVKFHAMQAFALSAVGVLLGLLVSLLFGGMIAAAGLGAAPAAGFWGSAALVGVLASIISVVILVFAIIAMIKAYKYTEYHIPLLGGIAAKLTGERI